MTHIAIPARPISLEQQAQQLGKRWRVTSDEREAIALDAYRLLVAYEHQGGRFATTWLKQQMNLPQASAVNVRRAGRALDLMRGLGGIGVSRLAIVGKGLETGLSLVQALMLLDSAEARRKAAEDANIGIASVKYSAGLTGEMADAYTHVANTYAQAGVPVPELPELTVSMAKLASQATPADIRALELGEAIGTQAQKNVTSDKIPSFYTWLARQKCAVSGVHGVQLHHLRLPDTADHAGGRRFADKGLELVLPLAPRIHQDALDAAHRMGQDAWSIHHFGRADGAYILAARYYAQYLTEHHLLREK